MSQEVEIWFDSAPPPAAIAIALERFGQLHEMRDGTLRLVEGDEEPAEGLSWILVEVATPPDRVKNLLPIARAMLRCAALSSAGRGYQLARMAAEIQRRLGGIVYLPASSEVFCDAEDYEASWPSEHGEHPHDSTDQTLATGSDEKGSK